VKLKGKWGGGDGWLVLLYFPDLIIVVEDDLGLAGSSERTKFRSGSVTRYIFFY
jgi:hypothetical protein